MSSTRRPRLLHVSQPVADGVAIMVADLTRTLLAAGWDVAVASPNGGYLADLVREHGARHVPWDATREPGPRVLGETRALRRIVRRAAPDVVHLHSSKAGLAGRLALHGSLPTIFSPHAWSFHHVHGATEKAALAWERFGARWADVVLCGSHDEARAGQQAGIGAQYRVISNSAHIDDPGLSRDEARARFLPEVDPAVPLVVCYGRFCPQKGQDIMLAAWPLIRAAVPSARLAFVGTGPDEAELRTNAPADVIFSRIHGRASVAASILSADVLAYPSRWETLSLAVLETFQLGRPAVVSNCGGMTEAMEGGAGAVVAAEDPAALAGALIPYLADRTRAEAAGREARAAFEAVHAVRRRRSLAAYTDLAADLAGRSRR